MCSDRRRKLVTAATLLLLTSCAANTQDVKSVLDTAISSMGAGNVRTIQFSGTGSSYQHGQALIPFAELPRFNVTAFDYIVDYMTPGSRLEGVRTQALFPPKGGSPQPYVGEGRSINYLSGKNALEVNP